MQMANTGGTTNTYKYDYLNRRSSKKIVSSTTEYIYDGQNLIGERGAAIGDFVFGPVIDEPLAMYRSAAAYYYDSDGLGSIALLNNTSGTVQDKYVYDGWGIVKSQTTPVANTFTYTAREVGEAELMYFRNRWMMPTIGRFISEDPIASEEIPPRVFLYNYVDNDPINLIDPLGLTAVPLLPRPDLLFQCLVDQIWDVVAEPLDAATSAFCGCKRSGKWQCFSKCYVYDINNKTMLHGSWYSGWGNIPRDACANAEAAARNGTPKEFGPGGFRTKHCDCPRQKCVKK